MTVELTADTPTMVVRIRDRRYESPWGVGLTNPAVRTIVISANCPVCGVKRGKPRNLNSCDDGTYYSVDIWDNPCGHKDMHEDVAKEADKLIELRQDAYLRGLEPDARVRFRFSVQFKHYDLHGYVREVDHDKRQVFAVNVDDADDKGWLPFRYVVLPEEGR